MKKHLLILAVTLSYPAIAGAESWQFGNFDSGRKVCTLTGWTAPQPSSRVLEVPATCTHTDGLTYTVSAIASGALDNLTEVTEIRIPSTIKVIGGSGGTSSFDTTESTENFRNCPALERFVVSTANSVFSSTAEGLLYKTGIQVLLRVPQSIPAPGGSLRVPDKTKFISVDAFSDNTTISTLYLPRTARISHNAGFNFMSELRSFLLTGVNSSAGLSLSNGALIGDGTEVHSFPPASTVRAVTLPATVKVIDRYAFRNAVNLESISLGAVEKISEAAFVGAGLKSVSIPSTVTSIGSHAFEACPELMEIHIDAPETMLYQRFAAECPKLAKVTSAFDIERLYNSAFINCRSLESFPFSAYTYMSADSIFYGCGFREVVFSDKPLRTRQFGTALFADNRNLELIDLSAVTGTEEMPCAIGAGFAADCTKLKTVRFPRFTSLWRYVDQSTSPVFGKSCSVSEFVFHTLWDLGDGILACYSPLSGQSSFCPKAYIAVTANSALSPESFNSCPVGYILRAAGGATLAPTFICDAYTPPDDCIASGATYLIPGATTFNYHETVDHGCTVRELFNVSFAISRGKLIVALGKADGPALPVGIADFSIRIDNEPEFTVAYGDRITSTADYTKVKKVRIGYVVDGVRMCTDYPAAHWLPTSGTDLPEVASSLFSLRQRRLSLLNPDGSFTLYSVAGTIVEQGSTPFTDLSGLPRGTYILRVTAADMTEIHKITL